MLKNLIIWSDFLFYQFPSSIFIYWTIYFHMSKKTPKNIILLELNHIPLLIVFKTYSNTKNQKKKITKDLLLLRFTTKNLFSKIEKIIFRFIAFYFAVLSPNSSTIFLPSYSFIYFQKLVVVDFFLLAVGGGMYMGQRDVEILTRKNLASPTKREPKMGNCTQDMVRPKQKNENVFLCAKIRYTRLLLNFLCGSEIRKFCLTCYSGVVSQNQGLNLISQPLLISQEDSSLVLVSLSPQSNKTWESVSTKRK